MVSSRSSSSPEKSRHLSPKKSWISSPARRTRGSGGTTDKAGIQAEPEDNTVLHGNSWQRLNQKLRFTENKLVKAFNVARRQNNIVKEDPPGTYEARVQHKEFSRELLTRMVARWENAEFVVTHETHHLHTILWASTLVDPEGNELPPGRLCLSEYPMVAFGDQLPEEVTGAKLEALRWLFRALAVDPQRVFYRQDKRGDFPVHALATANSGPAMELLVELCVRQCRLLTQVHGGTVFTGETVLHVAAVNGRETELCTLLQLAYRRLSKAHYLELIDRQPGGSFFGRNPMAFYGSTVVSFAASMGLKRAVEVILDHDKLLDVRDRLNDETRCCRRTGLMPLHCAVANGQMDMYDFLVGANNHKPPVPGETRLETCQLAHSRVRSQHTALGRWSRLTPLQLAVRLGDRRMAAHILRKRLTTNWQWGPLTSFRMGLREIDSVGDEGNDMLELVQNFKATLGTQKMLLDDFVQGFLFKMIEQKWNSLAGYIFYVLRLIECAHLGALVLLGFMLKQQPSFRSVSLAVAVLALGSLLSAFEIVSVCLWWQNDSNRAFRSVHGFLAKLSGLHPWCAAFSFRTKLLAYTCTSAAAAYYVADALSPTHTPEDDAPLYALLSLSSYFLGKAFISAMCVSPRVPKLGIQIIVIDKMFKNDVTTFLTFMFAFLFNYYVAMFIALPAVAQDGAQPRHTLIVGRGDAFNMAQPLTGLWALIEMAIIGARFSPNFASDELDAFSTMQYIDFLGFAVLELLFGIVCLILLVRLLMAMMTNGYRATGPRPSGHEAVTAP